MRKLRIPLSLFAIGITFSATSQNISGFSDAQAQLALESRFDQVLQAKNVDENIKAMSARPHHVGSAADKSNAEWIESKLKSYGFDTRIETFYVLFPTPKERVLELTGPKPYKALLSEPPLKADATSGQKAEQLPVYNCWSADGDLTAPLVFVNYGVPDDYERLERLGIDVKGKIVIAKYGRSWRGIKPKLAQEHGALGCIIYSDPKEDGYYQGDVYPDGPFKNEYGAQRGSVLDMPIYPGDPLTPNIGATKEAQRLDRTAATSLLKIPVIPISYHDALPLLKSLGGPVAPDDWRGALPITYHVGPGTSPVHLKLSFNWDTKPLYDVIATMKGTEFPDQWVMRGNHHDAWVNGANDPVSGAAAMLEEARAIGELAKTGWKPKRTIMFAAWDGEEPGLLGSTEWVEQHAAELQQKMVVYINSDGNGRGFLEAEGSHALEPMVNEIARAVWDPQTHISVFDRKRNRDILNAAPARRKELMNVKTMSIGALGSGSDYSPFIQHLGVPSLNLGFGGEDAGGEYHSIYDSYDDYRRFKDPTFEYGVALAKVAGRATLRMADAPMLPFDFTALSKKISDYTKEVSTLIDDQRESTSLENQLLKDSVYSTALDPQKKELPPAPKTEVPFIGFAELQNAAAHLQQATRKCSEMMKTASMSAAKMNEVNMKLYQAEQQLLTPNGLPRRSWYRHSIYAPGFYTGYGVKTLPGVREAIEQRNYSEAQAQITTTAAAINKLSDYLEAVVTGKQ
jgi:N-acetylated-alpha-linked acidic dipeptidase